MSIFGFIGTGNMGGAMATAARKAVPGKDLLLSNRTPEKARALAERLGARAVDNLTAAREADYLFLGVKPQMMAGMLASIRDALANRETPCVLVSMAAGLTMRRIREMAGAEYPIIRIMPNTPAAVGQGVVLCCSEGVDDAKLDTFKTAMAGAGMLDFVDEHLIDAGSAVSGCGPAFVYMFIDALIDAGVRVGLPRVQAKQLAIQTVLGSAMMCTQSGAAEPAKLKADVCSPAGSTIEGVMALEDYAFRAAVMEAVKAAYERTVELGK